MSDAVLVADASSLLITALREYPAEQTILLNVPKAVVMKDGRTVSVTVGRVIVAAEELEDT